MGFYRYLLAVLVLISHASVSFLGYNPGVVAVISFLIISGYVMTLLINRHYLKPFRPYAFYADRIARLFPQFLLYISLTYWAIVYVKIPSDFMDVNNVALEKIWLNFLMLPQGFNMFLGSNLPVLMPQSWSLALELCFYLIIPWILHHYSHKLIVILLLQSISIFLCAYLGFINTDYYGYRLIPGTLFIFLIGVLLSQKNWQSSRDLIAIFIFSGGLFLFLFNNEHLYKLNYNKEVLLGIMIGMACIYIINKIEPSLKGDMFFGNLSYGVFLNHNLVIISLRYLFNFETYNTFWLFSIITVSSIFSLLSFTLVEKPIIIWRHKLRQRVG